ncbi:MAG: hypothetical protein J6386_13025 [Candidatus Synoicihabitans palmerolidicus]|nr:hypothetical protein [Candidatus Synoicihabitans palmerolidicus]
MNRRFPFVVLICSALNFVHASEDESVAVMPDFVLEVNRNPFKPSKPGPMVFPAPPIRLIEIRYERALSLRSTIAANRRRPKLKPKTRAIIAVSEDLPPARSEPADALGRE